MAAPAGTTTRTVLVVDDQRAFAESLSVALEAQDDLTCVGIAADGREAARLTGRVAPDVVIMDVGLPDLDGIESTRRITSANDDVRVIVLTGRNDAGTLAEAAAAGAAAFLLKSSTLEEILDAVRQEATERITVDRDALTAVLGEAPDRPPGADDLTQRELEVLGQLARGRQPKQIARDLGVTTPTCRGYVKTLFQKLGAHSALEAVLIAHRHGVIRLPED